MAAFVTTGKKAWNTYSRMIDPERSAIVPDHRNRQKLYRAYQGISQHPTNGTFFLPQANDKLRRIAWSS
jgi:hypothetical protein